MITAGSMCTGYGGLDMAISSVFGSQLAWVADNDPHCSKVLAHRYPDVPNLGDIKTAGWESAPPVDILGIGFPCQPVSGAGRQKGIHDERWIWPGIAQAIGRMGARPRLLVLENVDRLLTVSGGAAMAQVVYSLAQLGYVGRYGLFRASDAAGACHGRRRWFCVAALGDADRISGQGRGGPGQQGQARPAAGHSQPDGFGWQKFEPAIARWELASGYQRVAPTEPSDTGYRIRPHFVEWMMGIPPGWVTDVPDLGRSAQIRIIGNGVVPQHGAAAITALAWSEPVFPAPAVPLLPTPDTGHSPNGHGARGGRAGNGHNSGSSLRSVLRQLSEESHGPA